MESPLLGFYPDGAIQMTPDHHFYKYVRQQGNKRNHTAVFNDTAVAVEYIIKSENGIVDSTEQGNPLYWITGDTEYENGLYAFLPIAVRSMDEGEVSSFFFSRRYMLGDAVILTPSGRIEEGQKFEAIVHLLRSTPINQIKLPVEQLSLPTPEAAKSDDKKKDEEKINKLENKTVNEEKKEQEKPKKTTLANSKDDIQRKTEEALKLQQKIEKEKKAIEAKRPIFGLYQLGIANELLLNRKIAASRKEFNRAKMAYGNQVDLDSVPKDFDDPMMHKELSLDALKNYILSRASVGIAKTFMGSDQPITEKISAALHEALSIDPECQEARDLLGKIGAPLPESVPDFPTSYEDARLIRPQFWIEEDVEPSKRIEFADYWKQKGTKLFRSGDPNAALKAYNKAGISFPKKALAEFNPDMLHTAQEIIVVSKLNALACHIQLGNSQQCITQADLLTDYIKKTGMPFNQYLAKCWYRKCLALIALNRPDDTVPIIEKLTELNEGLPYIPDIKKRKEEYEKETKKEYDFLYKKMTGTL